MGEAKAEAWRIVALSAATAVVLSALVVAVTTSKLFGAPTEEPTTNNEIQWRLFFTGDTRGYINPCGCSTGLFGGLPKRATFLSKTRRPGDVLIDLGNLIEGARPHERLKLRYVLEGLRLLEYDFLVPGEGELALGKDFERAIAELARPKVICANLVHAETRRRVYDPWSIRQLSDGTTVAVVGLTSPDQPVPSCYAVLPPAEVLNKVLASLRGKADILVVAAYLEGKPALDVASEFTSVDLVLAARVPRGSDALLVRGGAPVMLGGERGQYVSCVGFSKRGEAASASRAWLGDGVPDTPRLADLVRRYDEDAKQFGELFAREAIASFRTASWAGSASCAECHQEEHAAWKASKHAHAMAVLRERDQDRNPNCMKCHLQDLPVGSAEATESVRGVGCESCHGGGQAHIIARQQGLPRVHITTFQSGAGNRCTVCHDRVNSPRFDLAEYWRKIVHCAVIKGGEG